MSQDHEPQIVATRTAWLVWIVPLVALLVGGYLLYKEFAGRGPEVRVTFVDGSGIEAGKTPLIYRGVAVGKVEKVRLLNDQSRVEITARLEKSAQAMAREKTRFWVVRPRISTTGVSGLETLMRGIRIELQPGSGPPAFRFTGLEEAPSRGGLGTGRIFYLHSPNRGSVQEGVPILFRGVEVGEVISVNLSRDASEVIFEIVVDEPYFSLVRPGTVFWDAGGVDLKLGLLGARIRTGSLDSILSGAVAMAVSPESAEVPAAESGSSFELYPEPEDKWLEWSAKIILPHGQNREEPGEDNGGSAFSDADAGS